MEWIAKAKTPAQDDSGYTPVECVRAELEGQMSEKACSKLLRKEDGLYPPSIIAARALTRSAMRAKPLRQVTEIPDCAAQAALSGRGRRTM